MKCRSPFKGTFRWYLHLSCASVRLPRDDSWKFSAATPSRSTFSSCPGCHFRPPLYCTATLPCTCYPPIVFSHRRTKDARLHLNMTRKLPPISREPPYSTRSLYTLCTAFEDRRQKLYNRLNDMFFDVVAGPISGFTCFNTMKYANFNIEHIEIYNLLSLPLTPASGLCASNFMVPERWQ